LVEEYINQTIERGGLGEYEMTIIRLPPGVIPEDLNGIILD